MVVLKFSLVIVKNNKICTVYVLIFKKIITETCQFTITLLYIYVTVKDSAMLS